MHEKSPVKPGPREKYRFETMIPESSKIAREVLNLKITIELPDELAKALLDIAKVLAQHIKIEEEPKAEEPKAEEHPKVKLEEVRAKLAELSRAGKRDAVKDLIQSFGVQRLTDIPKEKLPAVLEKAKEIA